MPYIAEYLIFTIIDAQPIYKIQQKIYDLRIKINNKKTDKNKEKYTEKANKLIAKKEESQIANKKYLENLGQEENYCLTVDCYPSVDDEILDLIKEIYKPDFVIKSEDVFYEKDELNKMMKPFLTENRVRGVMYYGKMDDFIDDIKLAQY